MIPMPSAASGPNSHGSGLVDDSSMLPTPTATNIDCFITTESEILAAEESGDHPSSSSRIHSHHKGHHDAVRRHPPSPKRKTNTHPADISDSWLPSPSMASSCVSSDAGAGPSANEHQDYLRALTPGLASLSGRESAISSISSRRNSLTASSFHDSFPPSLVDFATAQSTASPHEPSNTPPTPGPQLIMPSLTVPRRRPFSTIGRSLGKLKILITGAKGIGKTSLIQSIAQSCEHIVHIGPVDSTTASDINETYASTKSQTWWQTTSDSTSSSRRRWSTSTDEILSRNLCFVEIATPEDADKSGHPALSYLESYLRPLMSRSLGDADLTCILGSGSEPIVDVILYILPFTGPTPMDLEYIEQLSPVSNVIPLIGRSDELLPDALDESKGRVFQMLHSPGIECFSFNNPRFEDVTTDVYAITSSARSDSQVMDASVLMSSAYMPPLASSDLGRLVDRIFSPEGSAQLRHSAAVKCVQWRQKQGIGNDLRFAICHRRQGLGSAVTPVLTANPYGQHPFWRRIEVSNWAQDLRQSLEGERLCRVACLSMDREALRNEAVRSAAHLSLVSQREGRTRHRRSAKRAQLDYHQDPLGLLQLVGRIQRGGQLGLEIASSVGAVGCLVAWLCRTGGSVEGDMIIWPGWCSAL